MNRTGAGLRKLIFLDGILIVLMFACRPSVELPPILGFLGTDTPTPTATATPTFTYTPTATFTSTFTPTDTPTATETPTITPSPTLTPRPYRSSGGGTGGTSGSSGCLQTNGGYVSQVIGMVNSERRAVGLPDLSVNWTLVGNSQAWSEYMAASGYWGHSGQNVGENIAAGQSSPGEVMSSWMGSDGHRANILNPGYTQVGAGYAYCATSQYGHYWTLQFVP
jgi:uncharacterized protein YkwD